MCKETWNWYPKIDVFVSNSYSEGLQVAPMEAMAMGCSVLSHHWHGADELVPHENLYLTDHELAAKLAAYLLLPAAEKQAAARAMRQRACDLFDVYDKIPRINQVIADAAGPAARSKDRRRQQQEDRSMKIGYLMQAGAPDMQMQPRSGPAAHVWHVCRELQALGHEVTPAHLCRQPPAAF